MKFKVFHTSAGDSDVSRALVQGEPIRLVPEAAESGAELLATIVADLGDELEVIARSECRVEGEEPVHPGQLLRVHRDCAVVYPRP